VGACRFATSSPQFDAAVRWPRRTPPDRAPVNEQADLGEVFKTVRRLELKRD
jgi:hypothetical protein